MGITVYLYDFPFTGERTIVEMPITASPLEIFESSCSIIGSLDLNERFISIFSERLYRDLYYMRGVGARYHGYNNPNIAFIGVGTGCILCGYIYFYLIIETHILDLESVINSAV